MSTPAQITICGALGKDAIATLVEVAISAGAALMLQPRAIAAPPVDVVEASPRRALPPARRSPRGGQRAKKQVAPAPVGDEVMVRVRRALRDGPMLVGEFLRAARLDKRAARRLVDDGVIVGTGVTRGRRYALPGAPAKEAP